MPILCDFSSQFKLQLFKERDEIAGDDNTTESAELMTELGHFEKITYDCSNEDGSYLPK